MIANSSFDPVVYSYSTNVINKDFITEDGFLLFSNMYANLDEISTSSSPLFNWRINSATSTKLPDDIVYKIEQNNGVLSVLDKDGNNIPSVTIGSSSNTEITIQTPSGTIVLETVGSTPSNHELSTNDFWFSFKYSDPDVFTTQMKPIIENESIYAGARVTAVNPGGFDNIHNTSSIGYDINLNNDNIVDVQTTITANRIDRALDHSDIRELRINLREPPRVTKIHFGTGNDEPEDYYYIDTIDCTTRGLGIRNADVKTQDNAQKPLFP